MNNSKKVVCGGLQGSCLSTEAPVARKLELMGEHNCPRWHRDSYYGRGIVSYNLAGTNYTAEALWQELRAFSSLSFGANFVFGQR